MRVLLLEGSLLDPPSEIVRILAERSDVFRVPPLPPGPTPEALLLGMKRGEGTLAPGPLLVSAFQADPPERSLHFALSLAGYVDGTVRLSNCRQEEAAALMLLAKKLNTRKLTVVTGEETVHGLVQEELGDLGTVEPQEGMAYRGSLPEGDGERELRRFIEDSVNLLDEHPVNLRRRDEDFPPLNLLWPWGQGVREDVPNLALRYGRPVRVETQDLRLRGLARLARLPWATSDGDLAYRRLPEDPEEARWLEERLVRSLVEGDEPFLLVRWSAHGGLALRFHPHRDGLGRYPFLPEVAEDPTVPAKDIDETVREALLLQDEDESSRTGK